MTYLNREGIDKYLNKNVHTLDYPEIYASYGDEINTSDRDWRGSSLKICVVSGMAYHNTVGNLGPPLVYSEILAKTNSDVFVDRAFVWSTKKNKMLFNRNKIPMFGVRSRLPFGDFDILLFSCSYLQSLFNPPLMLFNSGIPITYEDRIKEGTKYPVVVIGGHQVYNNVEFCHTISDFWWVGEFSAGAFDSIMGWYNHRKEGGNIQSFVDHTGVVPGVYVPSLYSFDYDKKFPFGITDVSTVKEGTKYPEKAYVKNLDSDYYVPDKLPLTFINTGMSSGELQASTGCDAAQCTFCSEGQTNKPYRAFSVEYLTRKSKALYRSSGAFGVTLSAYDGAGHKDKNHLLYSILENVSDEVSMLSLRVDEMAENPEFAKLSTSSGNKTVSMGVEGMSQRMRNIYQKWCTEEQLFDSVRYVFESGATKIKFFLICNHPWENEDDQKEWIDFILKVKKLKKEMGIKCEIKSSWTPLMIMPRTPLQWECPTIFQKSLTYVLDALSSNRDTRIRIGQSKRYDEGVFAQMLHLADRRFEPTFRWLIEEKQFMHVTTSKVGIVYDTIVKMAETVYHDPDFSLDGIPLYDDYVGMREFYDTLSLQKGDIPYGFHFYIRGHSYYEHLAWSHIKVGSDVGWLQYVNELSKDGESQITKCSSGCSACGGCDVYDRNVMQSLFSVSDRTIVDKPNVIHQRGTVQKYRIKVWHDKAHRFIQKGYYPYLIRRAFYMSDIPIDKTKVSFVTQKYGFGDITYGVDYWDVGMLEFVEKDRIELIRPYLSELGIELLEYQEIHKDRKVVRNDSGATLFKVTLSDKYPKHFLIPRIKRVLAEEDFEITIKVTAYKGGYENKTVEVRDLIDDIFVNVEGELFLLLRGLANPVYVIPSLLGTQRHRILDSDFVRLEMFTQQDYGIVDRSNKVQYRDLFHNPIQGYIQEKYGAVDIYSSFEGLDWQGGEDAFGDVQEDTLPVIEEELLEMQVTFEDSISSEN